MPKRRRPGPCWRSFVKSLAWIRQSRPGATDEWAWKELQPELLKAVVGGFEGDVPIDKFRYPLFGRMDDLVTLIRNGWLNLEDVQWPKVECNLKWLEQRWPHETDVPVAAETVESPPQAERPPAPVAPAPPAAKNVSEAALERCIRAMEKECAEQQRLPPTEKELHEEVEHRLETEVPRDRVRDARDRVAPNFRRPVGKPRKNAQ